MTSVRDTVAIIGAGLGGAALALALNQYSIPCRIYEARDEESGVFASGVSLAPNGCRVLDALGVLDRIRPKSYQTEAQVFRNAEGEALEMSHLATEELYGYKNHRLYRLTLIRELRAMLRERKIPVEYGAKFNGVVTETTDGVTFIINDRTEHSKLLIGADGIHSAVRTHITTKLPEYLGLVCIYGHIPTDSVPWPSGDFEKVCTIQDKPGALFMVPEVADGSDLMVGMQFAYPRFDRAAWRALETDKEQLCALIRKDYKEWHGLGQSIIDELSVRKEGLLFWPFHRMPKLERWSSPSGRVMIIGDAAHAMPPSSGQGVNQALEDAYTLALLLRDLPTEKVLADGLQYWHDSRQARIDVVLDMVGTTNMKRLPEVERQALERKGEIETRFESSVSKARMEKLFGEDIGSSMATWRRDHV